MKSKIFLVLLCLISNIGLSMASIESGNCGENGNNCTYSFDTETGILTISGNGNMKNYARINTTSHETDAPWKNKKIVSIIIEDGVTSIGTYAFFGGYYSGTYSDTYPYFEIGKNLADVTIPNSVLSIGDNAFAYCTHLTSVNIPNSVTSIGEWAFAVCSNLPSITIGNGVTSIGEYAFYKCTGLTSVTIGNSVISIGGTSFYGCSSLTSVTIPNSVTSIDEIAFECCTALTSVIIGHNVTKIGEQAFYACNSLATIYYESAAPAPISNNTFPATASIYVPKCAYTTYQNAPIWKDLTIVPIQINMQVANNIGGVVVETCGSMEIEAIPFDGYHFKKWLDGNTDNPRAYSLKDKNLNYIAQFEINKYTITLNCDANQGSVIGDKGKYNYETDHTIEAVPNYGYHFTQWSDGETENPREFTLVQDTTFTALFAPNKYTLTIQYDNTYGSVEGDQGSFDYLSEHEIQVNAKYGYHFTEWSDGVTDNPRTLILTKDTTITASFAPNKYQLELIADAEMGTINGEQGSFNYLSEHEITAVPNTGYLFSGWSDGATENPRTITLTRDTSITAIFEHNLFTVTLLCDENQGSVSKSGDTHHSGSCTITATPKYGYHFTQWTDGDTNNPRTFIVTQDTMFTAEFAVDKNGTCGDELALTWTYNDEAKELTISGDGSLNSNYTFGVEAPTSVEKVIFEEGVTSIGNSAFANYTTLKEIHFAKTIKKINEQTFYNCENLENLYCYRDVPCVVYNNTFDGVDKFSCTLHVHAASIDMYKAATGWRDFFYVVAIPEHPTALDQITNDQLPITNKIIKDNQILILRGEKVYTVTGQEVK